MSLKMEEPFQVLVDGNFVYAALLGKIDLRDALPLACQGRCHIKTTRCVLEELKLGGDVTRGALVNARKFDCLQCCNGTESSPTACIKKLVGPDNPQKFVVGTQDMELRAHLRATGKVPVLAVRVNVLAVEKPSNEAQEGLQQVNKATVAAELQAAEAVVAAISGKESSALDETEVVEVPIPKKRKRTKEPNPLSCRKKKSVEKLSTMKAEKQDEAAEPTTKKRTRIRKRSRAGNT